MTQKVRLDLSRAGFGKGVLITILLLGCSAAKLGSETYSVSVSYPAMYGNFDAIKVRDYFTAGPVVVGHFTPLGLTTSTAKVRGVQLNSATKGLYLYSSGGITFGEAPAVSGKYAQFVDLAESADSGYLPNMCKWVAFTKDVVANGASTNGQACGGDSHKYVVIGLGPTSNTANANDTIIYLSSVTASGEITGPIVVDGSMLCCRVGY